MDNTTAAKRGNAPKQIEWNGDLPLCDICKYIDPTLADSPLPAAYDGPTRKGPWGNMCDEHFVTHCSNPAVGFQRIKGTPAVES